MPENKNYYLLTGGPGSGKSTVLNTLEDMGYHTVQEVARTIIRNQIKTNGDALPWKNISRYIYLMLSRSITDFEEFIHINTPCFFDRGIIDTLGFCHLINLPVPRKLTEAARKYRYNSKVFVFPFWKEIYTNDSERVQNTAEAEQTFFTLKETYENLGYQTIVVPFLSPRERAEWIIKNI